MKAAPAWIALAGALALAAPVQPAQAAESSRTLTLLDTKAQRVDDTVMFAKWTRAVTRHNFQMATHVDPCGTPKNESCFLGEWKEKLTGMEGKPQRVQLELVNRYLNASPYVLDIALWGVSDYWETPLEFLMFSGDCEDYAIAKFFSLLRLGFSNEQMQIVILQDQNLKIPHAVLAVMLEGVNYILDNQIPQVVRDTTIHHYTPYYGVNLTGWWRYAGKSSALTPGALAPRP